MTAPLALGELALVRQFVAASLRTDAKATIPAAMCARVLATLDDHDERRRVVDEMTNPTPL